jgi:hypothetical protein
MAPKILYAHVMHARDSLTNFTAPVVELDPIPLAWPFSQWGLYMVGKLHKSSPGGQQMHQVDRGNALHHPRCYIISKLHQINSFTLRSTKHHHHGQWFQFHIKRIPGLLQRVGYTIKLCISCPPVESQRIHLQRHLEKAIDTTRKGKWRLGIWVLYSSCYRAYEQLQMLPLKKHLSSWSMTLRRCF